MCVSVALMFPSANGLTWRIVMVTVADVALSAICTLLAVGKKSNPGEAWSSNGTPVSTDVLQM